MLVGVFLSCLLLFPAGQDSLQKDSLQMVNPMQMSPEMKQFLDTNVDRGLPPMERLRSLVSAVFQSHELNFSYAPVSRTAIETFTNRNGNCLSFTLLFITMSRYLNLDARFREVEIPPMFNKTGAFVNLSQHLNAAVLIGKQAYAIDVFPGVVPIDIGGQIVSDQRGLAHFLNNKGVDELGKENYELADLYLKKALETDPSTVGVWINLGAARTQVGKLDEAERYYRKALELEPKNLAAMSNLANICELTGRTKESIRLQTKVREFREKNPYHHFYMGLQAYQQGDYQGALAHYRQAVKLKSSDHNFYFAIARVYAQTGQNAEMLANLQLAEKNASDSASKLKYAQKLELLKNMRVQSPGQK